ncbi:protein kinase [Xylaria sp. FL1777]|nr:protein kinase [Xylaria sp. FL1777]
MLRTKIKFSSFSRMQPRRFGGASSERHHYSRLISTSTMSPYNWIDGVEPLEMYEPGGYHPVMINDVLHKRYRIIDKLGYGGYSTIWLALDDQLKRYVAIKVNIANSSLPSPQREARILRALSTQNSRGAVGGRDAIPKIMDEFSIEGPNGTHACYTVAPAQGNLQEASFSRLFPIHVARALAARLVLAVSYVHSQGFVHGDIRLRNVLTRLPSTFDEFSIKQFKEKFGEPETIPICRIDGKPLPPNVPAEAVVPLYLGKKAQEFTLADADGLTLGDFGEAFTPTTEQRLGRDCHTPISKRAPEALFQPELPLSYPSDIWSLGAAIWDITGMKPLFSDSETQDEIVAEQIDVFGFQNFPSAWREQWERKSKEEVDIDQPLPRRPAVGREVWLPLEDIFEEFVQKYRKKQEKVGIFDESETWAFLDLMRGMFKFQPEEPLTIDEVLQSEWMNKWALPHVNPPSTGSFTS